MKKILTAALAAMFVLTAVCACGLKTAATGEITVVTREDGSGTRGAFIELFGLQETQPDGAKKDMTYKEAIVANRTDVMMTTVANDVNAIGYISLGSLNATVKAVDIDGVKASADNVRNGSYAVSRPFVIAINGEAKGLQKDFIEFILSAEGQAIVSKNYIAVDEEALPYSGEKPAGKLVVAGSSSVSPLMELLAEEYIAVNPDADIEIQTSDSGAGISAATNGTCDIGMASRELKESEKEKLTEIVIAVDGIAVIVNKTNALGNLAKAQVKEIFTGNVVLWDGLAD